MITSVRFEIKLADKIFSEKLTGYARARFDRTQNKYSTAGPTSVRPRGREMKDPHHTSQSASWCGSLCFLLAED